MKPRDLIEKILEETYILSGALEVEDIDMVLEVLSRRDKLISQLGSVEKQALDDAAKADIEKFDEVNTKCMAQLLLFKEKMNSELYEVKSEQKKAIKKLKVHDSYSNPYASSVGTSFDLKK